jgi:hypothetical protein
MKKAILPAVFILMTALYFGCAKKKTNVEFDMPYTYSVAVPAQTVGVLSTFTTTGYPTNIGDKLSSNGTNGNLVGEMKCTSFSISATSPTVGTGSTLSYIRSIKFYVNAVNQPELNATFKYNEIKKNSDGTTTNDSIYPTTKTTSLHINDNNLKNRFIENSVYYKVKIDPLYSTPPMTITVTQNIHVKAISEK